MDRRAPTLEEVAIAAGVSRSTASRVINGAMRVAPETQQAVEYAIERLGYVPNHAARSLVTRRTQSIALVMPESDHRVVSDPFLAGCLSGVNAVAGEADVQLIVLMGTEKEPIGRIARYLQGGHVDGAVVVSHHRDDGLEETLRDSRVPAYFIGRPHEPTSHVRYVDVDNLAGGKIATELLLARGARSLVTIAGPADMPAGEDRLTGWHAAMSAAGLAGDRVAYGDFTTPGGAAAMQQLLERYPDLDGVFAASDQMAAGAMHVLSAAGRRIPEDVAVVGFDNLGIPDMTSPRLTTLQNPVRELATLVTQEILKRIADGPDDEADPVIAILAPAVVAGESV